MNIQALAWSSRPLPAPRRRMCHPVLEALGKAERGDLSLITPEGARFEFAGGAGGPSAHMKLYDWKVLDDLLSHGEMGLAESYADGRWASENLPALLTFGLLNADVLERFFYGRPWYVALTWVRQFLSRNSLPGSRRNIMEHYDLGNDFYRLWLDEGMTYSCGLFEGDADRTLEEAQAAKYRRALRKIDARLGDHVLDIGCGWGGFAEAAAQQNLRVTAITLSEEQASYARERLREAGLQHLVSIQMLDYREIAGRFDHIVSIGMFEHVGERYWPVYFRTIRERLKPGGRALIQSITLDDDTFESRHGYSGFMEQTIFPGGMLPSKKRFCAQAEAAGLACHDLFTFGEDYARTAQLWLERFHAHADEVRALGYDEAFIRLWRFYLSACIASFESGRSDVMQVRLAHQG